MAAGTAVKPMTMPTAEDVTERDFTAIVAAHRPQIFRFLLASTRDADLAETLTRTAGWYRRVLADPREARAACLDDLAAYLATAAQVRANASRPETAA